MTDNNRWFHPPKRDAAHYLNAAVLLSIAAIVCALILYLTSVLNGRTWGIGVLLAAILTLLGYLKAEEKLAVRVILRIAAWGATLAGWIATAVTAVMLLIPAKDPAAAIPLPWIAATALALNVLPLFSLPVWSVLAKHRSSSDVWMLRISGLWVTAVLIAGCIWCGDEYIVWGIGHILAKVFASAVTALVPTMGFLIPTKKKTKTTA